MFRDVELLKEEFISAQGNAYSRILTSDGMEWNQAVRNIMLHICAHQQSKTLDNSLTELSLPSEEYLDRDEKECYVSMMSIGDTGRGPLLVLGLHFSLDA